MSGNTTLLVIAE